MADFQYMPHVAQMTYEGTIADVQAAATALREGGRVVALFTVGFCMGGRLAFLSTTFDIGPSGAIGFYGWPTGVRTSSPAPVDVAAEMQAPILGIFGGADEGITPDVVAEFEHALVGAGVQHELVSYPGAPHSFFDRKAEDFTEASTNAWRRTLKFIRATHPDRVSRGARPRSDRRARMRHPARERWQTPLDSRLMQALVSECWRADFPRQHLHAGDVDWWSVHAHGRTPGLDERIRLWFAGEPDATELIGFAWYGPPNEADLIVAPAARGPVVIGSMIDWVASQVPRFGSVPTTRLGGLDVDVVEAAPANDAGPAGNGPATPVLSPRVWTVAEDEASVRAQVELGLVRGPEPGFVHLTGRLDRALDLAAPDLPHGYDLGTIETDADVAARVDAGHAAFPGSTMTVEKYRFCRTTPLYRPALDTIVRGAGRQRCRVRAGLARSADRRLELEPVGVHPDHQRRGLGRAVCRAALRAGASLGRQEVVIAAERRTRRRSASTPRSACGGPIVACRRRRPGADPSVSA